MSVEDVFSKLVGENAPKGRDLHPSFKVKEGVEVEAGPHFDPRDIFTSL